MTDFKYEEIASMIDHALLAPTLTDQELQNGCELAKRYQVATVCVKPSHVCLAYKLLESSKVEVCTVIGFPHGSNTTEVKVMEIKIACQQGATEVDMVINLGKAKSGDWNYIENEITQACETAHSLDAKLKVIFENDYWQDGGTGNHEGMIIEKLCLICEKINVDWIKTSTGFGFVMQQDGRLATRGATFEDVSIMVNACSAKTQVKAAGGVKDLTTLLKMREIGATRIGTSSTANILEECRSSLQLPPIEQIDPEIHPNY